MSIFQSSEYVNIRVRFNNILVHPRVCCFPHFSRMTRISVSTWPLTNPICISVHVLYSTQYFGVFYFVRLWVLCTWYCSPFWVLTQRAYVAFNILVLLFEYTYDWGSCTDMRTPHGSRVCKKMSHVTNFKSRVIKNFVTNIEDTIRNIFTGTANTIHQSRRDSKYTLLAPQGTVDTLH